MRVVVFGDTGPFGAEIAQQVKSHGHEAVVVSRTSGVDPLTGAGLAETLAGCGAVVDLSGLPSLDDGTLTEDFGLVIDEDAVLDRASRSAAHLLTAETAAGVAHHVGLSVVGTDRIRAEGVFRALQARESLVRGSGTPFSIIRTTQLFESVEDIADAATEDWIVWVPPVEVRPVARAEVAALLAHTAVSKPLQGVGEIAGPDQFRLDVVVRRALSADTEHRRVFTDSRSTFFGARVRRTDLLPSPGAHIARQRYAAWRAYHAAAETSE
ncbi:hypothetical protein B1R27_00985 [Streptomyces sp. GKU 895]|nr:hypothetical protein B1R27_00985 [Streptomyces sp. GKU 895]